MKSGSHLKFNSNTAGRAQGRVPDPPPTTKFQSLQMPRLKASVWYTEFSNVNAAQDRARCQFNEPATYLQYDNV